MLTDPLTFLLRTQSVKGHLGGGLCHLEELVNLVTRGRLDVSKSVSSVVALADIHDGIRRLEQRQGNPVRIVVTPRM